jgi:hypothetical protein
MMTKIPPLISVAYRNKKKYKRKILFGIFVFTISLIAVIWAELNWERYSELRRFPLLGNIEMTVGPAPTALGWGLTFIILIPIIIAVDKLFSDYSRPGIGVNHQGFFINLSLFKNLFIEWDQFEKIEKTSSGGILLYMKNPNEIIASQPRISRWLLKKPYVKNKMPIQLHNKVKNISILEFIERHKLS